MHLDRLYFMLGRILILILQMLKETSLIECDTGDGFIESFALCCGNAELKGRWLV